jgi:hypothetical protein
MNETPAEYTERPPVGNLTDFVIGIDETNRLDIEVSVKQSGNVIVFHSHPFKQPIAWFEFDLTTNKLDFVLDSGDVRDFGFPLKPGVAKHMQNTHQILMVQMDPKTGEAQKGNYVPLIVHRT